MFFISDRLYWLAILTVILALWILPRIDSETTQTENWSTPELLHAYPDTSVVYLFAADVNNGVISAVQQHFDTTGNQLNYSHIFFLRQQPGDNLNIWQLTSGVFPAESPMIFRDGQGKVNIFWGERRVDPGFEDLDSEYARPFAISTALVHTRADIEGIDRPYLIYEGELSSWEPGGGGIVLPIFVNEASNQELHVVFRADGKFDEFGDDRVPGLAWIKRQSSGQWNEVQFLLPLRFAPNITALSDNRVVVAFFGADPFDPNGNAGDLYVIRSEDSGVTWSEPHPIFLSGESFIDRTLLKSAPDHRVHLIWGQYKNSGLFAQADEMWHSVSEDGGETWSVPERFFKLADPAGDGHHFIRSKDMVIDQYGQVHWIGVSHRGSQEGFENSTLHYATWNPYTKTWSFSDPLDFAEKPGQAVLALDQPQNKLYVFWETEEWSFAVPGALYYAVLDLDTPAASPIVAESGPLLLHANYPNPFHTSTTIPFTLEEPGRITLRVFDTSGRTIYQNSMGNLAEGNHRYPLDLSGMAVGTYIYELEFDGKYRQQGTMVLVR